MSSHRQWNQPGRGVLIFSCNPSSSRFLQGPGWRGTKSAPIFVPHRTKFMDAAPIISIDKRGISEILVESEEKREKSELSMGIGHTRESSNEINLLHLHVMPIEVQYTAGGIQTWTQAPRSVRSVRTSSSPSDSALFSFLLFLTSSLAHAKSSFTILASRCLDDESIYPHTHHIPFLRRPVQE